MTDKRLPSTEDAGLTEAKAQTWLSESLGVSRETFARLNRFRGMVIAENERQNLVSVASIEHFWTRHIADSAQLLTLGAPALGNWLDLGTGAGFPGMVIALLRSGPITFVESRKKRAEFLSESAAKLGLDHVTVFWGKLEKMPIAPFSVISARAFAPLHRLLPLAHSFSTASTLWLLPKGRSAREEVATVQAHWEGAFHVEPSLTDLGASIIIARQVARRGRR